MRLLPAVIVAMVMVVATPAASHTSAFSEAKVAEVGGTFVLLDFEPSPVFAGESPRVIVRLSEVGTNEPLREANVTLDLRAPGTPDRRITLPALSEPGAYARAHRFDVAGLWNTTLGFTNATGERITVDFDVSIYRDLPFRFRPADPMLDFFTNESVDFRWILEHAVSGKRYTELSDLEMRFEHWSDDHTVKFGTGTVQGSHEGDGLWSFPVEFRAKGMYHIQFGSRSGNVTFDEVPIQHIYALDAAPQDEPVVAEERRFAGIMLIAGGASFLALIGYFAFRGLKK